MQPELPWNIAGIPAEAREAVRAAARREGLSLGEWMTRQIVRGFPDVLEESALSAEPAASTERADASEQMTAKVNALAERLSRVERQVQSDTMREAVKALHQGLSRVADDIARAANNSGRRLDDIEQRVLGIVSRLEQTERANASAIARVEQTLRELAMRVEAQSTDSVPPSDASATPETNEAPGLTGDARQLADDPAAAQGSIPDAEPISDAGDNSATAAASDSASPPFQNPDVPSSAELSEPFAVSEGFLGEPNSFLHTARLAANATMEEAKPSAEKRAEFSSAVLGKANAASAQPSRRKFAVAASVFAAAVVAALGGVALTSGNGSTAPHSVPVSAASHQPHGMSARASKRVTVALANNNSAAPRPQIATAIKADVAAVVPSLAAGSATRNAIAAAAKVSAPVNTATVSAAPNTPEQRIAALANMGNPRAQLLLGVKYLDGNGAPVNEAEAARWLARAAQQGEPLAQYRLGTLYERGRGVPADARLATHWYGLAAAQGNRKAMHNLAVAFAEGSGTPKNESLAALWFARAANLGLADSQFNLAVLYERGMGVKQSLAEAYKWYLIAAAQGDAESKSRAAILVTQMKDSERAVGQRAAAAFRQQPLTPAANSLPVLG